MTGTISPAVIAGAAWLDQVAPGWEQTIDPDLLDLALCDRCVLGQIVRPLDLDYDTVADKSGLFGQNRHGQPLDDADRQVLTDAGIDLDHILTLEEAIAFGFHLEPDSDSDQWQDLTDQWRAVIASRTEQ